MRVALDEARIAFNLGEIPIGAVLVDAAGEIVARAHNLRETSHDATAHAEILAIRAACERLGRWRLTGCTLYVTIEPCPMCAGAIVNSRLDRVVYGAPDAKAGACESIYNIPGNPNLNHQPEILAGILEDECRGIMREFFQQRRAQRKAAKDVSEASKASDVSTRA